MANLKNITELPVVESAEGLKLIVNDNGAAKQVAASAVGMQADWAETDETSPAFVKNKPVEEWDLDMNLTIGNDEEGNPRFSYTVNSIKYDSFKNKIVEGIQPKLKVACLEEADGLTTNILAGTRLYIMPANAMGENSPEGIALEVFTMMHNNFPIIFGSDGSVFSPFDML